MIKKAPIDRGLFLNTRLSGAAYGLEQLSELPFGPSLVRALSVLQFLQRAEVGTAVFPSPSPFGLLGPLLRRTGAVASALSTASIADIFSWAASLVS